MFCNKGNKLLSSFTISIKSPIFAEEQEILEQTITKF